MATNITTANDAWANMDASVKSFLCVAITAVAALIEVTSTMVLAYPEHRAKEKGYTQKPFYQRLQMGGNVALMLLAVAVYTVGSFFGPVSLSVPAAMAAKLMWNMVELGVVLRMSEFAKEARVGTYILIISIVAMPGIGPTDQPDLDILQAMLTLPSIIWLSILCAATLACCVGMVIIKLRPGTLSTFTVYAILLTGQVTSAVVGTSAGKTFALLEGTALAMAFVLNTIVGAVNLFSNMVAATACDQAIFIPLQTFATLVVNCVTGLVLWQEYNVIAVPSSYVCVYLLVFEGVYIMSSLDVIASLRAYKAARVFRVESVADGTRINRSVTISDFTKAVHESRELKRRSRADTMPSLPTTAAAAAGGAPVRLERVESEVSPRI